MKGFRKNNAFDCRNSIIYNTFIKLEPECTYFEQWVSGNSYMDIYIYIGCLPTDSII